EELRQRLGGHRRDDAGDKARDETADEGPDDDPAECAPEAWRGGRGRRRGGRGRGGGIGGDPDGGEAVVQNSAPDANSLLRGSGDGWGRETRLGVAGAALILPTAFPKRSSPQTYLVLASLSVVTGFLHRRGCARLPG